MKLKSIAFIILTSMLSACATLNEQECKTADWFALGYEDASKGRPVNYIAEHREACAKHHITPSLDNYRQGHAQGLPQYCTSQNGYAVGRSGSSYHNVCVGQLADQFMPEYQRGRQIYGLIRQIDAMESDIRELKRQIDSDQKRIHDIEHLLVDAEADAHTRKERLKEMRSLEAGISEHLAELDHLYHSLENLNASLRALE